MEVDPNQASQMNIAPNNEEAANRFCLIAQQFCAVVDSAPNLERIELLIRIFPLLPQLIGEAICLPDVGLSDCTIPEVELAHSSARERARSKGAQWGQLYNLLTAKLGDWNPYWQVFDPTKEQEAIYGSLADDIADIYRDLKDGVILSESHQALPEDNIWHWRYGFHSHWGKHAMDALRTIHCLLEENLG